MRTFFSIISELQQFVLNKKPKTPVFKERMWKMETPLTHKFKDTPLKLSGITDSDDYSVLFRTHAAVYKIDAHLTQEVNLLSRSIKDRTPVTVECGAADSRIYKVET